MKKLLYWLIQMTWGVLTFIPGLLLTLILKLGKRPTYKNGYGFITTVGKDWGGLSLGPFAFCGRYNELDGPCPSMNMFNRMRYHEFGHSIQVLFMGPLFIIVVAIPSAIRYWYYRLTPTKKHKGYDDIWIEGFATIHGYKWIHNLEKEKI